MREKRGRRQEVLPKRPYLSFHLHGVTPQKTTIFTVLTTPAQLFNNINNNSNEKFKEKFGNYTRKPLDRFTTKDSYTWNITHNTERTAM